MSKHLYLYALPSDLDRLISGLRERLDVKVFATTSQTPKPTMLETPIRNGSLLSSPTSVSCDCFLVPSTSTGVPMNYYPKPGVWRIADSSEVIKVSGFDFDGKTLVQGHFYMGTDMLIGSEIVRKSDDFLKWGSKVFTVAKKQLHRSGTLNAYVAEDAMKWEREGGRYASLVFPGREPLYEKSRPLPGEA